jgi:hypothetical protein
VVGVRTDGRISIQICTWAKLRIHHEHRSRPLPRFSPLETGLAGKRSKVVVRSGWLASWWACGAVSCPRVRPVLLCPQAFQYGTPRRSTGRVAREVGTRDSRTNAHGRSGDPLFVAAIGGGAELEIPLATTASMMENCSGSRPGRTGACRPHGMTFERTEGRVSQLWSDASAGGIRKTTILTGDTPGE